MATKASDINDVITLLRENNKEELRNKWGKERTDIEEKLKKEFNEKNLKLNEKKWNEQAEIIKGGIVTFNTEMTRVGHNIDNVIGTQLSDSINRFKSLISIMTAPITIFKSIGENINKFKGIGEKTDKEILNVLKKDSKYVEGLWREGVSKKNSIAVHDKKIFEELKKNITSKDVQPPGSIWKEQLSEDKTSMISGRYLSAYEQKLKESSIGIKTKQTDVAEEVIKKKEDEDRFSETKKAWNEFKLGMKKGFGNVGGFLKTLIGWEKLKWMWTLMKWPLLGAGIVAAVKLLPGLIKEKLIGIIPNWVKNNELLKTIWSGVSTVVSKLGGIVPVLIGLRMLPFGIGKAITGTLSKGIGKLLSFGTKRTADISTKGIGEGLSKFKNIIKKGGSSISKTFKSVFSKESFTKLFSKSSNLLKIASGKLGSTLLSLGKGIMKVGIPGILIGAGALLIAGLKRWNNALDEQISVLMKTEEGKKTVGRITDREKFEALGIQQYEREDLQKQMEWKKTIQLQREKESLQKQLDGYAQVVSPRYKEIEKELKVGVHVDPLEVNKRLNELIEKKEGILGVKYGDIWEKMKPGFTETIGNAMKDSQKEINEKKIKRTDQIIKLIKERLIIPKKTLGGTTITESGTGVGIDTGVKTSVYSIPRPKPHQEYNYDELRKEKALGDLRITDTLRPPGTLTAKNKLSYHSLGQAADVAASKQGRFDDPIEQRNLTNFAKWAANSKIFDEVLWNVPNHYDHVHVAWGQKKDGRMGDITHAENGLTGTLMAEGFMQIGNKLINFGEGGKKELLQITPENRLNSDIKEISDLNMKMMANMTGQLKNYIEQVKDDKSSANNILNNVNNSTVVPNTGDRAPTDNISEMKFFPTDVAVQNIIWMSRTHSGGY